MTGANLTERQQKWFASLEANLEKDTGKTLSAWIEIAKTCPETKPRARLKWFKDTHGLAQNRASYVLAKLDGKSFGDNAEEVLAALWKSPEQRAIYDKIVAIVASFDDHVIAPRKTFVGFSRKTQFAAAKPIRGAVRLGLCLTPETHERLIPSLASEPWADRISSMLVLENIARVDDDVASLLHQAYET